MSEVIVVSTKQELIGNGYVYENIGKEFVYEGTTFLLKQQGLRHIPLMPFMGYPNPNPRIVPKQPVWLTTLNDIEMTITNIK